MLKREPKAKETIFNLQPQLNCSKRRCYYASFTPFSFAPRHQRIRCCSAGFATPRWSSPTGSWTRRIRSCASWMPSLRAAWGGTSSERRGSSTTPNEETTMHTEARVLVCAIQTYPLVLMRGIYTYTHPRVLMWVIHTDPRGLGWDIYRVSCMKYNWFLKNQQKISRLLLRNGL